MIIKYELDDEFISKENSIINEMRNIQAEQQIDIIHPTLDPLCQRYGEIRVKKYNYCTYMRNMAKNMDQSRNIY